MYSRKVKVNAVIASLCILSALKVAHVGVRYMMSGRGVVPLIVIVLLLGAGIAMAIDTRRCARAERLADQECRDRVARQLAEEAERRLISEIHTGGNPSPFVLYLRPFFLEKAFRVWKAKHGFSKLSCFSQEGGILTFSYRPILTVKTFC
jgi:hypothetical protein